MSRLAISQSPNTMLRSLCPVWRNTHPVAFFASPDQGRVGVTASDVRETAAVANDVAERVWALPCHSECAAPARADPTDPAACGLGGDAVALLDTGEQVLQEELRVVATERVVLPAPVVGSAVHRQAGPVETGIDEDGDRVACRRMAMRLSSTAGVLTSGPR